MKVKKHLLAGFIVMQELREEALRDFKTNQSSKASFARPIQSSRAMRDLKLSSG